MTNPATGEPLDAPPLLDAAGVDAALDRAQAAWHAHRESSMDDRAAGLRRVAGLLERDARAHAERMTREMGKPVAQAEAEARKCAWVCRHYADHGAAYLADEPVATDAARSFVAYRPLGPLLAVMPWNFPYWQALRAAAPAVMAGNTVVLKHAENVRGCGDAIAALFREAGFAEGVVQHAPMAVGAVAGAIADSRIAAATLTGSERAGRAVGEAAGRALKPVVLELGGSDAFVVLADADVDRAARVGLASRVQNNGQSCIAAKRFILHRAVADAFTERFVAAAEALVVGDPMDAATDLGPLAREGLRGTLHEQVGRSVAEGARLLTGGAVPEGPGWYYPPTVLAGVPEGGVPYREELFGPVAALTVADDDAHAVRLANATPFGLGGSVWTRDAARGLRVARQIHAGAVFVNAMTRSHPALPFGGVGVSGVGRELGRAGIRAFTNATTVWVGADG